MFYAINKFNKILMQLRVRVVDVLVVLFADKIKIQTRG